MTGSNRGRTPFRAVGEEFNEIGGDTGTNTKSGRNGNRKNRRRELNPVDGNELI